MVTLIATGNVNKGGWNVPLIWRLQAWPAGFYSVPGWLARYVVYRWAFPYAVVSYCIVSQYFI